MPSWKELVLVKDHPMRRIFIEKVVVNIGVGTGGERLERAAELLKELTGAEPSRRRAKRSIKDFGIRKGEPIGVAVTLRRDKHKLLPTRHSHLRSTAYINFRPPQPPLLGLRRHVNPPLKPTKPHSTRPSPAGPPQTTPAAYALQKPPTAKNGVLFPPLPLFRFRETPKNGVSLLPNAV